MPAPPNRLIRRAMLAAACATALTAASAHADPWTRSAPQRLTAAELGLSRDAAAPVLARAALRRSAARLGLARSAALALDPAPAPAGDGPQLLRFRQSLGGLRVLWSRIDVTVRAGAVQSISATTLPARRLSGARRLSADRARAIARRAAGGRAVAAELVAYAGEPGKPRVARRAYVVTVAPARQAGDVEQTTSVVVDAGSGAILKRFAGSAARRPGQAERADVGHRDRALPDHQLREAAGGQQLRLRQDRPAGQEHRQPVPVRHRHVVRASQHRQGQRV